MSVGKPAPVQNRRLKIRPPLALAVLYAMCILLGASLIMLPISTYAPITWADAFFTATSAVTVTGLVVLDTGSDFTLFGQFVIMLLIQLGGLGLMTFAVLVISLLGLHVGIPHRVYLKDDLNHTSIADVVHLVSIIFRVVLIFEFAGAILLAAVFVPEFGWKEGLWQSIFHSVSAFNNAGFALFPDSLSRWAGDPLINTVIPVLFIAGGIGYAVISDIYQQRSWRRLSLHSKLMLFGTAVLILASWLLFAALEWNNPGTLGGLSSTTDRWLASWFQATTTRTAGFNTVDIGAIHDSTAMLFMSLMFIGGGTTSTAGGIKVTTFIVLVLAVVAFFRRRPRLRAFGRSLGPNEVMKVLALTVVSFLTVLASIFIITISHDGDFLQLAFEAVSAFGTVGLSQGATAELDGVGRSVIMFLMFIGRVGPLTLGFFLASPVPTRIRYPAGKVGLG